MVTNSCREDGQAVVEFALIAMIVLMLSAGLVDAGRFAFQYNAVSQAARYAARWASVVGGMCHAPPPGSSSTDWCSQEGAVPVAADGFPYPFFLQDGNRPLQPSGTPCPTNANDATFTSQSYFYSNSNPVASHRISYYAAGAGSYAGSKAPTTIVGAIVQRFDSNENATNTLVGQATPGIDLSTVKVCIQLPSATYRSGVTNSDGSSGGYVPASGDTVTVVIYDQFTAVDSLVFHETLPLRAVSQFPVE
jgi:Flp pilus assembly protein TadG